MSPLHPSALHTTPIIRPNLKVPDDKESPFGISFLPIPNSRWSPNQDPRGTVKDGDAFGDPSHGSDSLFKPHATDSVLVSPTTMHAPVEPSTPAWEVKLRRYKTKLLAWTRLHKRVLAIASIASAVVLLICGVSLLIWRVTRRHGGAASSASGGASSVPTKKYIPLASRYSMSIDKVQALPSSKFVQFKVLSRGVVELTFNGALSVEMSQNMRAQSLGTTLRPEGKVTKEIKQSTVSLAWLPNGASSNETARYLQFGSQSIRNTRSEPRAVQHRLRSVKGEPSTLLVPFSVSLKGPVHEEPLLADYFQRCSQRGHGRRAQDGTLLMRWSVALWDGKGSKIRTTKDVLVNCPTSPEETRAMLKAAHAN